jgi:hypothetical protein
VIRNEELIEEPYIRTPRSTYGGSVLAECSIVTVPPNAYFVLGDNRRVSSDSRFELGFVAETDISFYLPLTKQTIYTKLWRDTTRDAALKGTPTLNANDFYTKLNDLKRSPLLENSARIRGVALLKNRDTTTDARRAMNQVGYSNIATGEFTLYGSATADELWESLMGSYDTKTQLQNPNYDNIGLSVVTGEVDGCPTQVIVGHLGGYVPATYDASILESWKSARDSLDKVIPSWEAARGQTGVDQVKLETLLQILYVRRNLAQNVVTLITNQQWISDELQKRINADKQNADRADSLAKELNGE